MRVVFFGLPLAALLLLRDNIEIALAATSRSGAPGIRRLRALLGSERVVGTAEAEAPEFAERVRKTAPDLLVSWFWTKRIPRAVLEVPRLGAVGVHPSLLPRHRGPDPYFWAIESGDLETGVTAHRLDENYDTGAILGQRRITMDAQWNAWTLAKRLDRPSLALLRDVVAAFACGRPPGETPQREAEASFAPAPDEGLLALRFDTEASKVVRRIRAASPWPGAFTEIGDALVILTDAREASEFPRALLPGEAAVRADGLAVVRTRDTAVELLAGRDEDGHPLDAVALAGLVKSAGRPA
jgi:methionyl-tRNA formyltransferase